MGDVLQAQAVAAAADEVGVWPGGLDEKLISELLSNDSLLGALVPADADDSEHYSRDTGGAAAGPCNSGGSSTAAEHERLQPATVSRALCSVYSGPTIRDIEKALSSRPYQSTRRYSSLYLFGAWRTAPESKYTTKLRSCGGKMPTDGYKWRKYGQKAIKNSPHPRSYYKCTGSRCSAKKHVEKSTDDPEMLIVTYEGSHLHGPQPLLRHPPPAMDFSGAAGAAVYEAVARKKARPSPTPDDHGAGAGAGCGVVGSSKEMCDAEVRGGKLQHERQLGRQKGRAHDAVPRVASSVPHADAAAVFSSDSPTTNWSSLDIPLEALLSG